MPPVRRYNYALDYVRWDAEDDAGNNAPVHSAQADPTSTTRRGRSTYNPRNAYAMFGPDHFEQEDLDNEEADDNAPGTADGLLEEQDDADEAALDGNAINPLPELEDDGLAIPNQPLNDEDFFGGLYPLSDNQEVMDNNLPDQSFAMVNTEDDGQDVNEGINMDWPEDGEGQPDVTVKEEDLQSSEGGLEGFHESTERAEDDDNELFGELSGDQADLDPEAEEEPSEAESEYEAPRKSKRGRKVVAMATKTPAQKAKCKSAAPKTPKPLVPKKERSRPKNRPADDKIPDGEDYCSECNKTKPLLSFENFVNEPLDAPLRATCYDCREKTGHGHRLGSKESADFLMSEEGWDYYPRPAYNYLEVAPARDWVGEDWEVFPRGRDPHGTGRKHNNDDLNPGGEVIGDKATRTTRASQKAARSGPSPYTADPFTFLDEDDESERKSHFVYDTEDETADEFSDKEDAEEQDIEENEAEQEEDDINPQGRVRRGSSRKSAVLKHSSKKGRKKSKAEGSTDETPTRKKATGKRSRGTSVGNDPRAKRFRKSKT